MELTTPGHESDTLTNEPPGRGSKLKESADDNFKYDENGRKFSKWVENTVGKGVIARYTAKGKWRIYVLQACT